MSIEARSAPSVVKVGEDAPPTSSGRRWKPDFSATTALRIGFAAALLVGVVLRFVTTSELWLDEALSVNIARLPAGDMLTALRHDGHPPLYYFLLHWWMEIFGDGDFSTRAISGVFSVGALAAIWSLARRLGGPSVGWAATLLLASSPFAVRYATEARMYALLVLLTLLGGMALHRALERPSPWRLAGVALATGALSLTHYWALYLIVVTAGGLVVFWRRSQRPVAARRTLFAMGLGLLLFLPWLPSFLYQVAHTGTPWSIPGTWSAVAAAVSAFAGGVNNAGVGLSLLFFGLAGLAVFGRRMEGNRIELDLRPAPLPFALAVLVFGTLTLAIAVGLVFGSAYTSRYASVVVGPFLVLIALGTSVFSSTRVRIGVVSAAVVFGLGGNLTNIFFQRTQAGEIAEVIERRGEPGDVVLYCPDQLGPAHERQLDDGFRQFTFPEASGPRFVDWVDYEERNEQINPSLFARRMHALAGPGSAIWLVSGPDYLTYGDKCDWLEESLEVLRPTYRPASTLDPEFDNQYYEPAELVEYPGSPNRPHDPRSER